MMPSAGSDGSGGPGGGSSLRRWGPVAAIVVVLAVVGVLVVAGGGDDDDPEDAGAGGASTTAPGGTEGTGGGGVAEAISFSEAQEQGLDVEFPDTCDEETGRVAMPYYFAPECFANVEDNGGATDVGVTADSIKIVVYLAPEQDDILDFITAAIANDDTNEQVKETLLGYVEMFNDLYQTYGRTVEIEFLDASGQSSDEVAARADAVRAVEEMGAFAVWGTPALTDAWSQEIAARGVPCIGCFGLPDPDPNVFTALPADEQGRVHLAEYLLKKLAGNPAVHAGDEAMQGTERSFGHLYIETGENSAEEAADMQRLLEEGGSGFTIQVPYELSVAELQETAAQAITRFKDAGVTSVVFQGDPVALATFTPEATAQNYFPEWIIGPATLVDTSAFGRTYDQEQWSHAFGLSSLAVPTNPDNFDTLYEWYFGVEEAPANDTEGVISPNPAIFFAGLQNAGPNLTRDSLRAGIAGIAPRRGSITAPSFSYGDHGLWPMLPGGDQAGIDDYTEIWWDADQVGRDELEREGPGVYRYVDGGQRYYAGEWPEDLRVFEEEGSVFVYDELPESEATQIKDYASPS